MYTLILINAETPQSSRNDRHNPLDRFFEFNVTRAGISVGGGVQTGMSPHHLPPSPPDGYDCVLARYTDGSLSERASEFRSASQSQQFDKIVVPVDMSIKRRLTNTEFISHASERDRVEPFAVCKSRGALNDLRLVQSPPRQSAHTLEAITVTLERTQRGGLD